MTIGDRIRYLRETNGWSQLELAEKIGINNSVLSRIEAGKRPVEHDELKKFAKIFNVSSDWLLFDGIPVKEPVISLVQRASRLDKNKQRTIPILGTIKAGLPILAEEHWEGEIEVPEHIHGDFALRVEGDSMIYAGILPGDIAILKSSNIAQHGQVVAAGVEEEAWRANLKFFVQTNGQLLLRSANPDYEDIEFTPQHRIIGVLAGLIRDEPPTLNAYMQTIITKDELQELWMDVIETAMNYGLGPSHMKQLIEVQGAIAQKLKERSE